MEGCGGVQDLVDHLDLYTNCCRSRSGGIWALILCGTSSSVHFMLTSTRATGRYNHLTLRWPCVNVYFISSFPICSTFIKYLLSFEVKVCGWMTVCSDVCHGVSVWLLGVEDLKNNKEFSILNLLYFENSLRKC